MSLTKRWYEEMSQRMGHGGDLDDEIIKLIDEQYQAACDAGREQREEGVNELENEAT